MIRCMTRARIQGGTFWYHPHHHGSTEIQTGGGAFGMIIVEDEDDEVPPVVAAMPERVLAISHLHLTELREIQSVFNDALLQPVDGGSTELMLVNGQTAPLMTIEAGTWYRWRMLFTSSHGFFAFFFDNPSCTMELLAKVSLKSLESWIFSLAIPITFLAIPIGRGLPSARSSYHSRASLVPWCAL